MKRLLILLLSSFIVACTTVPEEAFEVEKQTLHKRTNDKGEAEFAFIVTVKATPRMELAKNKPVSKKELKEFAEFKRVEESPELKLALEESAVELLEQTLKEESYCQAGYNIDNVYWRQRSVQLRGHCL
ncbi:hypothetical protein N480_08190 [Pseudoalteromonas luteoviolacea S2607]|uniref:hypothetical protein n=1 Tax=Pseudoalteromonas luteoviolacea TaxID=43657 RepID=UPI0007B07C90|nr:hypothetical protein [Pseudoalteromonas luteoviolacea]KZN28735.1 hypothetical protein N480_08190 [Pseudoalteromonas luteoviolacea S2607]